MTEPTIDIESFIEEITLGELETLEDHTGQPIATILRQFERNEFSARTLTGIVLLYLRRSDPDATVDDARATHLVALADVTGAEVDDAPK